MLQVIKQEEIFNREFKVYGDCNNPLFLAKDIANFIEHSDNSKMLKGIDEDEKLTGTIFLSGQKRNVWFLTEFGLYEVLMQSRKPIAKKFKLEVKRILKELRVNGIVASENITQTQEENFDKFGTAQRRRKLFENVAVENIDKEYKACMEYLQNKNSKDRIRVINNIVIALESRRNALEGDNKLAYSFILLNIINRLQSDIRRIENNRNGGIKAGQTRVIKQLTNEVAKLEKYKPIRIEDMNCVNVHPFSVNFMYSISCYNTMIKNEAYKRWIFNFPNFELPPQLDVDYSKPMRLTMVMDHKEKFDVSNFHKSFLDILCSIYNFDDRLVELGAIKTNKFVNNYKEGKIYWRLENV